MVCWKLSEDRLEQRVHSVGGCQLFQDILPQHCHRLLLQDHRKVSAAWLPQTSPAVETEKADTKVDAALAATGACHGYGKSKTVPDTAMSSS